MVTVKEKETTKYPLLSISAWWVLRRKFAQTIPTRVTDNYLAGILTIQPISAKKNVMSPLKRVGLIEADGKPTERATRWRDDNLYPIICEEIRKEIYPQELLDTFSDADAPRPSVERWFANATGVGEAASKKMAAFYLLLVEADPTKQDEAFSGKISKPSKAAPLPSKPKDQTTKRGDLGQSNGKSQVQPSPERNVLPSSPRASSFAPSLHIDIQIHIHPDASPEQIDQIFASMSKHLYKGDKMDE